MSLTKEYIDYTLLSRHIETARVTIKRTDVEYIISKQRNNRCQGILVILGV